MTQTLRSYQVSCRDAVLKAQADGWKRVIATAPTGSGKSLIFSSLVSDWLTMGLKVLVVVDGTELVTQGYESIKSYCHLSVYEIAPEQGKSSANQTTTRVVVGSLDTIVKEGRLSWFAPDVIIVDECDQAASKSHKSIAHRFGVYEGRCFYVGFTATPKRHDKQALFAERISGERVELELKSGNKPAEFDDCVFQKHIFDYPLIDALADAWLVPIRGFTVRTATDLRKVPRTEQGDYQAKALAVTVQNAERTLLAIEAYREHLIGRPTLVFCASVEHAYHAQKLFEEAGFEGEVVDGKTDPMQRFSSLHKFKSGHLPLMFNFGVFTRGTDIPNCSGIIMLRPTSVWSLFCQMIGRGTRVLPGVVSNEMTVEDRRWEIDNSAKRDCIVIDVVDITDKHDACSVPDILDLPTSFDLEGHSVEEAKLLLDEFKEVREQVIGECPLSYRKLSIRLRAVNFLHKQSVNTQEWGVAEGCYRFRKSPPGYDVTVTPLGKNHWKLIVNAPGGVQLLSKTTENADFADQIKVSQRDANNAIKRHSDDELKNRSLGNFQWILDKSFRAVNLLVRNGINRLEIDAMSRKAIEGKIKQFAIAERETRKQQAQQEATAA